MQIKFRCDPALIDLLPRPAAAREFLPDWLREMPRQAFSDLHGDEIRTVKHCPPFVDAMSLGFVIPLPCDVTVQDGQLSWDWAVPPLSVPMHPRAPVSFHAPSQVEGTPFHQPGQVIVKFNSFWTVELPDGWSLFATHPVNRADLPFRLLSGTVDSDRFHDVGILFPATWLDPAFCGVLPRGMPIAHCIPVRRDPLVLDCGAFDPGEQQRYADTARTLLSGPGHYRKHFRAPRSVGAGRTPLEEMATQGLQIEPEDSGSP
jgi:hypothetical protein